MTKSRKSYPSKVKTEIALEAIKEKVSQSKLVSEHGVHNTQIKAWKQQGIKAVYQHFSKYSEKKEKEHEKLLADLYQEIGQLQTQLSWLKKNLNATTEEKRAMIDPNYYELPARLQCALLGLPLSSYHYESKPLSAEDENLMRLLDQHDTEHPYEGKIKRSIWLSAQVNYPVGVRKVRTLMSKMGLETIYPKPDISARNKAHKIYPYLLRDMNITHSNQVWAADITYCPLGKKHFYLFAIIDWYSRYVVDWSVSATLEADHCIETLERALSKDSCSIFNTDQGSQFTSTDWIKVLVDNSISISMDGRGCYLDNIFVERLWRSVKQECVYLHDFQTLEEIEVALGKDRIAEYSSRL